MTPASTSTGWPSRSTCMPFYRELDGEIGPTALFQGRQVVMLGSNNYLGLTTDARVRAAARTP